MRQMTGRNAFVLRDSGGGLPWVRQYAQAPSSKIIGMYIHQHWPYNHPYAARTWSLGTGAGTAGGLKKIGYNSLLVWPVAETMPDPLLPSDRASPRKAPAGDRHAARGAGHARLHGALSERGPGQRAGAACAVRKSATISTRINASIRADKAAMAQIDPPPRTDLKYLAKTDGVAIIDSDPGGYIGSTNREFVDLLLEHRKMFDRLRPGIELIYWMHAGWPA